MQTVKTPRDAKGSYDLKPVCTGTRDVLYSRVPRRGACNLRLCHSLRTMRAVNHIGRTTGEPVMAEVLQKMERQRYGTANRYYVALDQAAILLEKVNRRNAQIQEKTAELELAKQDLEEKVERRTAQIQEQATELEASNEELQNQQEELQQTNEELEEKSRLLEDQNKEVEQKNREVELAKQDLEEKAEQLALTSRYKSEFLANMSHELRTPLNTTALY